MRSHELKIYKCNKLINVSDITIKKQIVGLLCNRDINNSKYDLDLKKKLKQTTKIKNFKYSNNTL